MKSPAPSSTTRSKIAQAKVDLAHINAAIRIFEIGEDGPLQAATRCALRRYLSHVQARRDGRRSAKAALAKGPMNTRQLSAVLSQCQGAGRQRQGAGQGDRRYRLIHALRIQARIGQADRGMGEREGREGLAASRRRWFELLFNRWPRIPKTGSRG